MWYVIAVAAGLIAYTKLAHKELPSGGDKGASGADIAIAAEDKEFEAALDDLLNDPFATGVGGGSKASDMRAEAVGIWYGRKGEGSDPHELSELAGEVRAAPMMAKMMMAPESAPMDAAVIAGLPAFTKKAQTLSNIIRKKIDRLTGQGAIVDEMFAKIDSGSFTMDSDTPEPAFVKAGMIDKAARSPFVFAANPDAAPVKTVDDGYGNQIPVFRGKLALPSGMNIGDAIVAITRYVGLVNGKHVSVGRVEDISPDTLASADFKKFAPANSYIGKGTNIYVFGLGSA